VPQRFDGVELDGGAMPDFREDRISLKDKTRQERIYQRWHGESCD